MLYAYIYIYIYIYLPLSSPLIWLGCGACCQGRRCDAIHGPPVRPVHVRDDRRSQGHHQGLRRVRHRPHLRHDQHIWHEAGRGTPHRVKRKRKKKNRHVQSHVLHGNKASVDLIKIMDVDVFVFFALIFFFFLLPCFTTANRCNPRNTIWCMHICVCVSMSAYTQLFSISLSFSLSHAHTK